MMRSVYLKTMYDKRWFILGWTLGFAAFSALMASFYPAMNQEGVLDSLVANMPKAFEGLIGNLADLKDFPSYLGSQLFDIRLPIIAGIMAIILGLSLSTSEEESGELRTLAALSIGRTKLVVEKWLALATIMFVTMLGLAVGIYAVLPFIDATIDISIVLRLLFMTWLLMTAFGTVAFAAGVIFGNRGVASALSIFVVIGSFLLSTFGQVVEWLEKFEKLSLIYYFPAVETAQENSIHIGNVAVLVLVVSTVLSVAIVVFRQRDIN